MRLDVTVGPRGDVFHHMAFKICENLLQTVGDWRHEEQHTHTHTRSDLFLRANDLGRQENYKRRLKNHPHFFFIINVCSHFLILIQM